MCPGFLKRLTGGSDGGDSSLPDPAPTGASFRDRVERFWDWFEGESERLHGEVKSGSLDAGSFVAAMENVGLGLAWEFCKGDDAKEGFVLSGESDTTKCLLARHAIECGKERPALQKHWNLHHMKRPSEGVAGGSIQLDGERSFAFSDFLFAVDFDAEAEQLQVHVHHPLFESLEDGARWHLTWLALDNALGESLVMAWVGPVEPALEPTKETRHGIDALRTQARAALSLHDLDPDLDPLGAYASYERREPTNGDLEARGDVVAGTTRNFDSIRELENEEDEIEIEACGASLVYLALPVAELGDHRMRVDARADLEDLLQAAMGAARAGEVIGGATGRQYAYIDLLLFDQDAGLAAAREVLAASTSIHHSVLRYFSPSRAAEQVNVHGDWDAPPPGFAS